MQETLEEIKALVRTCQCGNAHHSIPIEQICIAPDALEAAVTFIQEKGFKQVVIAADKITYEAAGRRIHNQLTEASIDCSAAIVLPDRNNDVVADERSLVQVLLEIPPNADVIVAVGAGTLHDISRFCAYKMGLPFISVPTASSVDGFTSMGAPLIVRGVKRTFKTISPLAVFADLDLLKKAPREMIAAGFGDMVAKYTSLPDWTFGHLAAGEPYCPLVAQLTRNALDECAANVEEIAKGSEEGIRVLTASLIQSGLAMLIFGQSHPASGGEHHLSHFWEMAFLQQQRPMVLHGAKVGVATVLLAGLYRDSFLEQLQSFESLAMDEKLQNAIRKQLPDIIACFRSIPEPSHLREMIEGVGGKVLPEELGIDQKLVRNALAGAYHLRDRFTALKFINTIAKVDFT